MTDWIRDAWYFLSLNIYIHPSFALLPSFHTYMTFYLFISSHLSYGHAIYLYVLFQKEGPMEDWFYQIGNPLKIKN